MPPLQWFEKTVEYKYVIDNIYNGEIYPFSGNLETWFGDAMHSSDGKFKLIEFKRSAVECRTERQKIRDRKIRIGYGEIIDCIKKEFGTDDVLSKGHYLVYGKLKHRDHGEEHNDRKAMFSDFELMQRSYWIVDSEKPCKNENMVAFDSADLLKRYLMVLYRLRREEKSSSGDGTFVEVRYEDQALLMTIGEFIGGYDHCLKSNISSESAVKFK